MIREGDVVIAKRPLGSLARVPAGAPGRVERIDFLGQAEVSFFEGPRLRVGTADLDKADPMGPWGPTTGWWLMAPSRPAPEEGAMKTTSPDKSRTSVGLRALLAVPVIALLLYALIQLS
ncbi:hypothetical protein [Nocardiopsis suaedae]|uniref:Uncharacterized protein n=1 Tax=Nocardiopsis suaedae TaxID=3018444 RepID=A0ABT4TJV3_9ACTN|nr:hypothetical protein [Nocardiopsis suaedae]MDA2804544.1 hypothetical protein [Nocardiopsis suaedae]